MTWGFVAGAAGTVLGSVISADAAGDAADTQAGATAAGIAEQRRQYDLTRADYAPWREAGENALTTLVGEMNTPTTAADVMSDPGYQFGLQQGQQALDRKAAAAGGRISGASLKAASGFATGQAASGFNAAYQRKQDRLNRLQALAGIGQTATGSSAAAGANMANNVTGLISSQGDASAAARMAESNIWGNTANSIAALYSRNKSPSAAPGAVTPYYSTDPSGNGYW